MSIEIIPPVCPVPAENEEDCSEGIDGQQDANDGEKDRREDPRGSVSVSRIEGLGSPKDGRDTSSHLSVADVADVES